MFTSPSREGMQPSAAETHIGPSVKVEGNFSGDGDVVIEGVLMGTLSTKGDVRVGTNAVIEAEVKAKNATIAGKVRGNITTSNHLKLMSTAGVSGDIKAMTLTIEEGAVVNGKIMMSHDKFQKDLPVAEPRKEKAKTA